MVLTRAGEDNTALRGAFIAYARTQVWSLAHQPRPLEPWRLPNITKSGPAPLGPSSTSTNTEHSSVTPITITMNQQYHRICLFTGL